MCSNTCYFSSQIRLSWVSRKGVASVGVTDWPCFWQVFLWRHRWRVTRDTLYGNSRVFLSRPIDGWFPLWFHFLVYSSIFFFFWKTLAHPHCGEAADEVAAVDVALPLMSVSPPRCPWCDHGGNSQRPHDDPQELSSLPDQRIQACPRCVVRSRSLTIAQFAGSQTKLSVASNYLWLSSDSRARVLTAQQQHGLLDIAPSCLCACA